MHTTTRIIAMAVLLCAVSFTAGAEPDTWRKIALDKTHIACLVSDPARASTLYAASSLGLLKSLDQGKTWNALGGDALPRDFIPSAVAINPHNSRELYVSYDGLGLFKSIDGGQTWLSMNQGLPNLYVRCITISRKDPNLIYLGIQGGVAISTNGGKFWHMSSGFRRMLNVNNIAVDPKNPEFLFAGTGGAGVFKSGNGGVSWRDFNEGLSSLSITALHIDPEDPDIVLVGASHPATPTDVYVGDAGGGVYRSVDGGRSWQESSLLNIHIFSLAADPIRPNVLYAGAWGGMYRSVDKGQSWTDINAGLDNAFPHAIHVLPGAAPPILFAGTTFGLLMYTDAALADALKQVDDGSTTMLIASGLGIAAASACLLVFARLRRRGKRDAQDSRQPIW